MPYEQLVLELAEILLKRQLKLAVAESCTGGGLAYHLTHLAGSSQWFDRGYVTYSNAAKTELLQVSEHTLTQYGAVSAETAAEMAAGCLLHSHAGIALSITGIAGPAGGTPAKPVGTVWFGLCLPSALSYTACQLFKGNRETIRDAAIHFALTLLIKKLQESI